MDFWEGLNGLEKIQMMYKHSAEIMLHEIYEHVKMVLLTYIMQAED